MTSGGLETPAFLLLALLATPVNPSPRQRTVRVDGAAVRYTEIGSGKTGLVFVHGWSSNRSVWRYTLPAFASRAHLVALDLPGHGESAGPAGKLCMALFVRSIAAAMKDAGMKQAVLVGHSNGAPVIRSFYRAHPRKTLALVSVDGPLRSFFSDPAELAAFVTRLDSPSYKDLVGRLVDSMTRPPMTTEMGESLRTMMLSTPQATMVQAFAAANEPGVYDDDPIAVPLLMVLAKQPAWPAEYEAYVRTLAPDVDYRMFEGVGHFLMMEKPETLNASLAELIGRRGLLRAAER